MGRGGTAGQSKIPGGQVICGENQIPHIFFSVVIAVILRIGPCCLSWCLVVMKMLVNIFLRARKKEPCQRRISFKTINQIKILQTYNGCRFCPWEFFWGRKSISEKTLQISRNLSLAL